MLIYDEVTRRFVQIEICFSGKYMPGDGPSPHWRGSGSLSGVNAMQAIGYHELVTPADLRGKQPADVPFVKRY